MSAPFLMQKGGTVGWDCTYSTVQAHLQAALKCCSAVQPQVRVRRHNLLCRHARPLRSNSIIFNLRQLSGIQYVS